MGWVRTGNPFTARFDFNLVLYWIDKALNATIGWPSLNLPLNALHVPNAVEDELHARGVRTPSMFTSRRAGHRFKSGHIILNYVQWKHITLNYLPVEWREHFFPFRLLKTMRYFCVCGISLFLRSILVKRKLGEECVCVCCMRAYHVEGRDYLFRTQSVRITTMHMRSTMCRWLYICVYGERVSGASECSQRVKGRYIFIPSPSLSSSQRR